MQKGHLLDSLTHTLARICRDESGIKVARFVRADERAQYGEAGLITDVL